MDLEFRGGKEKFDEMCSVGGQELHIKNLILSTPCATSVTAVGTPK